MYIILFDLSKKFFSYFVRTTLFFWLILFVLYDFLNIFKSFSFAFPYFFRFVIIFYLFYLFTDFSLINLIMISSLVVYKKFFGILAALSFVLFIIKFLH